MGVLIAVGYLFNLVAFLALLRIVWELYTRNVVSRAECFRRVRDDFERDPDVQQVRAALAPLSDQLGTPGASQPENVAAIEALTESQKRRFLRMIEEISLLARSGIIDLHLATYLYGDDAITAYRLDAFWNDGTVQRDHARWALFTRFVKHCEPIRYRLSINAPDALSRVTFHHGIGRLLRRATSAP